MTRVVASVVLALIAAAPSWAADATKPHEHKGSLKPYPRPPPPLVLTDAEQKLIDAGKSAMRQIEGEKGGRGMAIFKVDASPDVTWALINEFSSYPKFVPEVKKCEVYKRDGGKIDVAFTLKSFPVTIDYFIHHDYNMAERWGTWTLDYSRESDLDDSVGFWRVTPVANNPKQSIVEYSVDIAIKGWVPGFVRELLVDKGLKQATSWVKKYGEERQRAADKKAAEAVAASPAPPTTGQ